MSNRLIIFLAPCAVLVAVSAGASDAVRASDYSHTCRVEGGAHVIDDGSLYEMTKYKSGSPGELSSAEASASCCGASRPS